MNINPSYGVGFARNAAQSEYPELWRGLVGLWSPSLGPTGLTLYDWSGNKNRGALTNMDASTDWVVGEKGYALDYDGDNDFVDCGDDDKFTEVPLSVAVWAKGGSIASGAAFVSHWQFGATGWILWSHTDALKWGDQSSSRVVWVSGMTIINDGEWHLIVGTIDASFFMRLYVDGSEKATAQGAAVDLGTNLIIGAYASGSADPIFAQIGSVSIYNRALNPNEIASMFVGASPLVLRRHTLAVTAVYSGRGIGRGIARGVYR